MQRCPCAPHFISPREGWNMLQLKVMCPISVQAGDKFIAPLTIYNPSEPRWCGPCYLSCSSAAALMMLRLWGASKISTFKIREENQTCWLRTSVRVVPLNDAKTRRRCHHIQINCSHGWNCTFFFLHHGDERARLWTSSLIKHAMGDISPKCCDKS